MLQHPDQITDAELDSWIRRMVDNSEPESISLDYKQILNIGTAEERRELSKDISSFANEIGGTIIYGIPERQLAGIGPVPLRPYGMDIIPGVESIIENIFVNSITPILPEYRIRCVNLSEYAGKVVYAVWVPESWTGPHMVQGYTDGRYYRRGEFRSIIMSERDVEQRYQKRFNLTGAASQFVNSLEANYLISMFRDNESITSLEIVPELLSQNRVDFSRPEARDWLRVNRLADSWSPSMNGVKTWSDRGGRHHREIEMHRNGAIIDLHYTEINIGNPALIAYKNELRQILISLRLASSWYRYLSYGGPLYIKLTISCPPGFALFLPQRDRNLPLEPAGTNVNVIIEPSSSDLIRNVTPILTQVADGIFRCFGLWEYAP